MYGALGQYPEAANAYLQAIELNPSDSSCLGNLAHLYATCPDADIRNGSEALRLAKIACSLTDYKNPWSLSNVAAAYAELGNFQLAIDYQEKAIETLSTTGYNGVGTLISQFEGSTKIVSVLPGSPADQAGIEVGDIVVAIDGLSTVGVSHSDLAIVNTPLLGTKVTFTIKRDLDERLWDITLIREELSSPHLIEFQDELAAYKAGKPWRQKKNSDNEQQVQP